MFIQQNTTCHKYGLYDIVKGMKTTIEIADQLLLEAKQTASQENRTLREIIEASLRKYLSEKKSHADFQLKKKTFAGLGLQTGATLDWADLSEKIY